MMTYDCEKKEKEPIFKAFEVDALLNQFTIVCCPNQVDRRELINTISMGQNSIFSQTFHFGPHHWQSDEEEGREYFSEREPMEVFFEEFKKYIAQKKKKLEISGGGNFLIVVKGIKGDCFGDELCRFVNEAKDKNLSFIFLINRWEPTYFTFSSHPDLLIVPSDYNGQVKMLSSKWPSASLHERFPFACVNMSTRDCFWLEKSKWFFHKKLEVKKVSFLPSESCIESKIEPKQDQSIYTPIEVQEFKLTKPTTIKRIVGDVNSPAIDRSNKDLDEFTNPWKEQTVPYNFLNSDRRLGPWIGTREEQKCIISSFFNPQQTQEVKIEQKEEPHHKVKQAKEDVESEPKVEIKSILETKKVPTITITLNQGQVLTNVSFQNISNSIIFEIKMLE